MIRSRTEATQSNSTSKIIQVNNHCLIIITKNSTNYSHVMLAVLVDVPGSYTSEYKRLCWWTSSFFYEAAVPKY